MIQQFCASCQNTDCFVVATSVLFTKKHEKKTMPRVFSKIDGKILSSDNAWVFQYRAEKSVPNG